MNADRRKELSILSEAVDDVISQLNDIVSDEQEYYDNMPESLQGSERGEMSNDAIQAMESAVSNLEDAKGLLEDALQ